MKPILFKDCKFILSLPEHGGIVSGKSILVDGRYIVAMDHFDVLYHEYETLTKKADVIDCSNKIVMPGLIDSHNHLCNTHMNLSRIIGLNYDDIASHMMTTVHDPYGWLTDEALYDISLASALNDIKQGATTIENSTIIPEVAYEAMKRSGMRGILAPQMATSFRLENDDLNWKEMLVRTEDLIHKYHDPDNKMSVVVHVHDLWDTLEVVMRVGLDMAEHYNTQYVTHFWEFSDAVERADKMFAQEGGALNHYLKNKLITDRCVLFHGSCLTTADIDRIAETGASIIHNPDINGTNCGNCAYIPYMIKKGINVGLGSDYGSLDVKTAMKLMLLVHNIMPRKEKGVSADAPLRAATISGAKAYKLDHLVGSLEPNKLADIIAFDLSAAPNLLPLVTSVIEYDTSILYFLFTRNAAGMPTSETMIDGKMIRRDGTFTELNEQEIVAKAYEWCDRFIPDLMDRLSRNEHYARSIYRDFTRDDELDLEALLSM